MANLPRRIIKVGILFFIYQLELRIQNSSYGTLSALNLFLEVGYSTLLLREIAPLPWSYLLLFY